MFSITNASPHPPSHLLPYSPHPHTHTHTYTCIHTHTHPSQVLSGDRRAVLSPHIASPAARVHSVRGGGLGQRRPAGLPLSTGDAGSSTSFRHTALLPPLPADPGGAAARPLPGVRLPAPERGGQAGGQGAGTVSPAGRGGLRAGLLHHRAAAPTGRGVSRGTRGGAALPGPVEGPGWQVRQLHEAQGGQGGGGHRGQCEQGGLGCFRLPAQLTHNPSSITP
ncbi:hypothetical protein B484DRAFT_152552 [Ochromonadaceae sp. CCMP2298]|nr:hypothetical protein B484DRAFT_152552 [Ochromonadaceae sp. CCMP2298]